MNIIRKVYFSPSNHIRARGYSILLNAAAAAVSVQKIGALLGDCAAPYAPFSPVFALTISDTPVDIFGRTW